MAADHREAVIGADELLISLHYLILSHHQGTPVRPPLSVTVTYGWLAANGGVGTDGVICGLPARPRACVVPLPRSPIGRSSEARTLESGRAPVRLVASRRPYRTLAVLEGPGPLGH